MASNFWYIVAANEAKALLFGPPDMARWCSSFSSVRMATAPQMASDLRWEPPVLQFSFPATVRQTLQDFEREKASPHLLAALAGVLPGLKAVEVRFDDEADSRRVYR